MRYSTKSDPTVIRNRYSRASMYKLEDAPFGSEKPYISFNVTFAGSNPAVWRAHAYLIHSSMVSQLGVEAPYGLVYCCVPELEALGACNISSQPLIDLTDAAAAFYEVATEQFAICLSFPPNVPLCFFVCLFL